MASKPLPAVPPANGGLNEKGPPEGDLTRNADVLENHGDPEKHEAPGSNAKDAAKDSAKAENHQPAGGFDDTPIPHAPPGWTIKFTIHRATNLPMADINSISSDPFVLAQLNTGLPKRHKEDPELRVRTNTIRRNCNPEWNFEWIVANVPASGFKLKARIYDEDPADHDDRLGNAHITADYIDENWPGIKHQEYKIKKRMGSKRAYVIRAVAVCTRQTEHMNGSIYVSAELLGRTQDPEGGRAYTVGRNWYTKHYSPLLGRITGSKQTGEMDQGANDQPSGENSHKKVQHYNFQANQFQLQGPVPAELYHRYVEFKSFIKGMFTKSGILGYFLSKALHHQHARVYNFDRSTEFGKFDHPCPEMTLQFLDLVHYDKGGRIFTYVLTLDSLFRFTETGKEFGIDMLSKHTMHSDVSIYIAFSGEFFIRRLKHAKRPAPEEGGHNASHPPDDLSEGPPEEEPPKNPAHYELIIDNDSGTYRPNAKLLPLLKEFMQRQFPGLKVVTLDCQKDEELMTKMKNEQRERKKKEGDHIVFFQGSPRSSVSSSDEEALDRLEASEDGPSDRPARKVLAHDLSARGDSRKEHMKNIAGRGSRRQRNPIDEEPAPAAS